SDTAQAINGNPQFAVIQCATPGRRTSNVKERLIGIQNDLNTRAGLHPELSSQVLVIRFQQLKHLAAKCFGALSAFVVKIKMTGLALGKPALRRSLTLSPFQQSLDGRV